MSRALTIALAAALLVSATAVAAGSITKAAVGTVTLTPGSTRTLSVPYPDALEYGNARYSGVHVLKRKPFSAGSRPLLAKVRILSAQSIEGGSLYSIRADNANAPGTAPVELIVTARTVEPLPHR
ncbi:MAG TPA: hypothetical protein VGG41_18880 [Solirubrobacteraceae bacterium]